MTTPVTHGNETQLFGPQHEVARQTPGHNQGASQVAPPEQPSTIPGAGEHAHAHTIKFLRPPLVERPKRSITQSMKIRIMGAELSQSTVEELPFCARKSKTKTKSGGIDFGLATAGRTEVSKCVESNIYCKYIVVGILGNERSIPHETLLPILTHEDLFKQIRKAERKLRSPFRRLLSLKRIGGFGLYRCHPSQDYHSKPDISHETTQCLVELYRNYRTEKRDYEDRWMDWIHTNFNNNSMDAKAGGYSLQLLLQWSPLKLIIWSSIPIIFSLVIGLWYMINPNPGEDYVAIVQTAWTIASYIVTTTALVLAVIASITQFGDT